MKQLITYLLLFSILSYSFISVSGCATILSGSKDEINLTSEPQGAKVLVNGINEGKTPLILNLKKGKDYAIEFVKEGFETKTFRLTSSLGAGWLVLDILLGGIIGIIVDAATGDWNVFSDDFYKANLEPKAESK
ncbi:MAG: PEGA domain-containing protein [Ignavibacteria bacterium]